MYKKLMLTKLWMLRSPEDDKGGGEKTPPVEKKLEDEEAFKILKSEVESLKKELDGSKEENKTLKSELDQTKKDLKDTRDAYKEMFGDKGKTPEEDKDKKAPSLDILKAVAECELYK